MKSPMKAMFVVLAIVISFVATQAGWAATGMDCSVTVTGEIISYNDGELVIKNVNDGVEITINGIPDSVALGLSDYAEITYFTSPDEKNIACVVDNVTLRGYQQATP